MCLTAKNILTSFFFRINKNIFYSLEDTWGKRQCKGKANELSGKNIKSRVVKIKLNIIYLIYCRRDEAKQEKTAKSVLKANYKHESIMTAHLYSQPAGHLHLKKETPPYMQLAFG